MPLIGPWACTFEFRELGQNATRVLRRARRLEGAKARTVWTVIRRRFMVGHEQEGHAQVQRRTQAPGKGGTDQEAAEQMLADAREILRAARKLLDGDLLTPWQR